MESEVGVGTSFKFQIHDLSNAETENNNEPLPPRGIDSDEAQPHAA